MKNKEVKKAKKEIEKNFRLKKIDKIVVEDKKQSKRINSIVSKVSYE